MRHDLKVVSEPESQGASDRQTRMNYSQSQFGADCWAKMKKNQEVSQRFFLFC